MLINHDETADDFAILLQVETKKPGILHTFTFLALFYGRLPGMCPNIQKNVPVLQGKLEEAEKAIRDSKESYAWRRGD